MSFKLFWSQSKINQLFLPENALKKFKPQQHIARPVKAVEQIATFAETVSVLNDNKFYHLW